MKYIYTLLYIYKYVYQISLWYLLQSQNSLKNVVGFFEKELPILVIVSELNNIILFFRRR